MLPKKLHIEQIDRFFKRFEFVRGKMKELRDDESRFEEAYKYAKEYFEMTELWSKLDEFTEFTLKHELDCLEHGIS